MSGEFAGYALDESIDEENDRWLYRQGVMRDPEAYERGIIDHVGRYKHAPMFPRGTLKTCIHCAKSGLSWIRTDKGWRLGEGGVVHACPQWATKDSRAMDTPGRRNCGA